jgi:AAA domain
MNYSDQQLLDVLAYWHKVEFFIPFDLKQVLDERDDPAAKWLLEPDLMAQGSASLWQGSVAPDRVLTGFRLFLGIFEMQAIADFAALLPAHPDGNAFDESERTELDGRSCMACIQLDGDGQPLFDRVSVSTAPWALGHAAEHGLSALTSDAFAAARKTLEDLLANFKVDRSQQRADNSSDNCPLPLSGDDLRILRHLFVDWAGYTPPARLPVALIQVLTKPASRKKTQACAATASAHYPTGPRPSELLDNSDDTDDEDDEDDDTPTIDILNSFYIDDIERCMASVRQGDVPAALHAYLTPLDEGQRVDLYTERGRETIISALHPRRFNIGHWLAEPSHKMSLMQQFSINSALDVLKDEGLFSVNGPPGTGKTTLLRDVICENVVQRAHVLAKLTHAADALANAGTAVQFADGTVTIRALGTELTGFEMVVASSNNAAVENISTDLPKRKRLGDSWRGAHYLQPVAHMVAALTDDGGFTKLEAGDVPWGLVSCALGNTKNRRRFAERFYFGELPEDLRRERDAPIHVRGWVERYDGIGFDAAKREFLAADAAVRSTLDERAKFADLYAQVSLTNEGAFTSQSRLALDVADHNARDATRAWESADRESREGEAGLDELREEERLIGRTTPSFFAKLFRTQAARRHAADIANNASAQRKIRKELEQCRGRVKARADDRHRTNAELGRARLALSNSQAAWHQMCTVLAAFQKRFAEIELPASLDALETDHVQKHGMWQDAEFAHLRSRLFAAGLALHEAWLAEVALKGNRGAGFAGNLLAINKFLKGGWPDNPAHVSLIWQSLFMITPVVSTTFASFARQFRHMGKNSIGWLFIDEAGQAVPQAAVGALWRSRRALVVGDPLQIEPVFTVPTRLINALAQGSPQTANGQYSPARVSVQRLADDANPYGTVVAAAANKPLWIGSPLRVHRRCADPMFSIANRIAYQEKMVFGPDSRNPPADELNLGASAWIDMGGRTTFKQVVPGQIKLVVDLIVMLFVRDGVLPALYVISPFKAIKNELRHQLLTLDWPSRIGRRGPARRKWKDWCKDRIGTVHTFQGKEEKVVIFVLGTDADSQGAASWAASKPNLLNVALTRAQHRFYVIGDATLWGGLRYFKEALPSLEKVTMQTWLARHNVAATS